MNFKNSLTLLFLSTCVSCLAQDTTHYPHKLSAHLGYGMDLDAHDNMECTKPVFFAAEVNYHYFLNKNMGIGGMTGGDKRKLDTAAYAKNIAAKDNDHYLPATLSTRRYYSVLYIGPSFMVYGQKKKVSGYLSLSGGYCSVSKQRFQVNFYPQDSVGYTYKKIIVGSSKSFNSGFYGSLSAGGGFAVMEDLSIIVNYSINYFKANVSAIYGEQTSIMAEPRYTTYPMEISRARHFIGLGIILSWD